MFNSSSVYSLDQFSYLRLNNSINIFFGIPKISQRMIIAAKMMAKYTAIYCSIFSFMKSFTKDQIASPNTKKVKRCN